MSLHILYSDLLSFGLLAPKPRAVQKSRVAMSGARSDNEIEVLSNKKAIACTRAEGEPTCTFRLWQKSRCGCVAQRL